MRRILKPCSYAAFAWIPRSDLIPHNLYGTRFSAPSMPASEPPQQLQPMQATLDVIVQFLRGIGLVVEPAPLPGDTFLPAIRIVDGGLRYDPARLQTPGDLLHEAGHIAIAPAETRATLCDALDGQQPGAMTDEVEAIAWSWAALVHLGLPGEVLFHPAGYKGQAAGLLMSYSLRVYPGAAGLARIGLCDLSVQAAAKGGQAYPNMQRWLR